MSARRGFTLLELLVTVTIALVVLAAATMLWGLAYRSQGVTAAYQALQVALVIEERIEADLERMMPVQRCPVRFYPNDPARLAFYVADPSPRADGRVGLRAVTYALERGGQHLMRESAGKRERVGAMPLASIAFSPFRSELGPVVRVALEIAPPADGPKGRSIVHTFLTRMANLRMHPGLEWELLDDFARPDDGPGDQDLPVP